ncbi:MAG: amidase family protein, partial [Granulosicoccaceae bacterium]
MHNKTLSELSAALADKQFSSEELTRHFLDRIRQYDGQINCYITVDEEQAMQMARAADTRRASGQAEALTGIPL